LPLPKAPRARQQDAARSSKRDTYTQHVLQYAALYALRRIKSDGADDRERIHTLTYNALDSEAFRDLDADETQHLQYLVQALERVAEHRAVTSSALRKALTAAQYDEYLRSFDVDLSHIEADYSDNMPSVLHDYQALLKLGDRYTSLSKLHRRAVKRDTHGQTSSQRFRIKAEACYESAVQMICDKLELDPTRNPLPNHALAAEVQQWLDRDVDTRDGFQPDIYAECVPRVRGSRSKYAQDTKQAVVGQRLRKHWRQREALVNAALVLMYDADELETQLSSGLDAEGHALMQKFNLVRPAQQHDASSRR